MPEKSKEELEKEKKEEDRKIKFKELMKESLREIMKDPEFNSLPDGYIRCSVCGEVIKENKPCFYCKENPENLTNDDLEKKEKNKEEEALTYFGF